MNKQGDKATSLFEEVLWAKGHAEFNDRQGKSLMRALHRDPDDRVVVRLVQDRLRRLRTRQVLGQLPPFKLPQLGDREFLLGKDIHGPLDFLIRQWLTEHLGLWGGSGFGKSNLAAFLLRQVAASGCPIWMTDLYKSNNVVCAGCFDALESI